MAWVTLAMESGVLDVLVAKDAGGRLAADLSISFK